MAERADETALFFVGGLAEVSGQPSAVIGRFGVNAEVFETEETHGSVLCIVHKRECFVLIKNILWGREVI
jgi:hypothetical protein